MDPCGTARPVLIQYFKTFNPLQNLPDIIKCQTWVFSKQYVIQILYNLESRSDVDFRYFKALKGILGDVWHKISGFCRSHRKGLFSMGSSGSRDMKNTLHIVDSLMT